MNNHNGKQMYIISSIIVSIVGAVYFFFAFNSLNNDWTQLDGNVLILFMSLWPIVLGIRGLLAVRGVWKFATLKKARDLWVFHYVWSLCLLPVIFGAGNQSTFFLIWVAIGCIIGVAINCTSFQKHKFADVSN